MTAAASHCQPRRYQRHTRTHQPSVIDRSVALALRDRSAPERLAQPLYASRPSSRNSMNSVELFRETTAPISDAASSLSPTASRLIPPENQRDVVGNPRGSVGAVVTELLFCYQYDVIEVSNAVSLQFK